MMLLMRSTGAGAVDLRVVSVRVWMEVMTLYESQQAGRIQQEQDRLHGRRLRNSAGNLSGFRRWCAATNELACDQRGKN